MKTALRFLLRWVGRLVLLLVLLGVGLWLFGPREPVVTDVTFDQGALSEDVDAYLLASELAVDGVNPDVRKRVVWAGQAGQKTPLSIVYIHGFSATSEEIRPVPDKVAEALGANLYFARLTGHGRDGPAMAEATVEAWMTDTAEALAIGRAIGEDVIVMSTSTGGTLAAVAATNPAMSEAVKGMIFVSPNFGINNPAEPLLTWPAARSWLPMLVGAERSFEPQNEGHGTYWTTQYPSVAVFPMAAIVKHAAALDYSAVKTPALFYLSMEDRVVRPDVTERLAENWGARAIVEKVTLGAGDDPFDHVIAGDILSPGQTPHAVAYMLDWIIGL